MIITAIKLALIFIAAMLYWSFGLILIPFGLAGKYYRGASGRFGRDLLWIAGGKPTWSGLDKLDPNGSYIFVGNHQSYADIFLIETALYKNNMRTLFMVKEELFAFPLFETMSKHMGLITVARDESKKAMQAMLAAIKTIKQGYSLSIFAEGTRTTTGELLPFKRGAFMMAEKSGKTVVPFVITGTRQIFPKEKLRITSGPCHITFMEPIPAGTYSSRDLAEKVEALIHEQYEKDRKIMDEKWKK